MRFKILSLCVLFLLPLLVPSKVWARSLGMNDVSQLLPLPTSGEMDALLKPSELLPYDAYRLLPLLSDQADQDQLYLHNLKVIGIRFDPCFAEGVNATVCRPQIRLVWQPLAMVGDRVTTLDTAIHSFHEFSESEWKQVVVELRLLPALSFRNDSLMIQPTLQQEGYRGNYWKALKNLILRFCNERNLIRMTAMTVRMSRLWTFAGIDRNGSGWKMIHIPTLDLERPVSQTFMLTPEGMQNLNEFAGGVSYLPKSEAMWMRLASDSIRVKELESEASIHSVIRRAIRLENPRLHNPGTADCVSCHMAQTVRLWGEKNFPNWNWQRDFANDRFTGSARNLQNHSVNPFQTDRVRAFGYFGKEPIFSQRVIHETALVADRI